MARSPFYVVAVQKIVINVEQQGGREGGPALFSFFLNPRIDLAHYSVIGTCRKLKQTKAQTIIRNGAIRFCCQETESVFVFFYRHSNESSCRTGWTLTRAKTAADQQNRCFCSTHAHADAQGVQFLPHRQEGLLSHSPFALSDDGQKGSSFGGRGTNAEFLETRERTQSASNNKLIVYIRMSRTKTAS